MKLRAQGLWFVAASTGGFFLLVAAVGMLVLLPAADDADRQSMSRRLERLQSRIDQQIEQIRVYAHEYGPWTDTAEFAERPNPTYVEANLGYDSLSGSGMGVVAIWDATPRLLAAKGYDASDDVVRDVPATIIAALEAWPGLDQRVVG